MIDSARKIFEQNQISSVIHVEGGYVSIVWDQAIRLVLRKNDIHGGDAIRVAASSLKECFSSDSFTLKQAKDVLKKRQTRTTQMINELVDRKLVKKVGAGPSTRYKFPKNTDSL